MVQYTTTKVKKYRGIHGYINKLQDCNYLCLGCWSLWLGKQFLPGIDCIIAQKYPTQDVDSSLKFYTSQKGPIRV